MILKMAASNVAHCNLSSVIVFLFVSVTRPIIEACLIFEHKILKETLTPSVIDGRTFKMKFEGPG